MRDQFSTGDDGCIYSGTCMCSQMKKMEIRKIDHLEQGISNCFVSYENKSYD